MQITERKKPWEKFRKSDSPKFSEIPAIDAALKTKNFDHVPIIDHGGTMSVERIESTFEQLLETNVGEETWTGFISVKGSESFGTKVEFFNLDQPFRSSEESDINDPKRIRFEMKQRFRFNDNHAHSKIPQELMDLSNKKDDTLQILASNPGKSDLFTKTLKAINDRGTVLVAADEIRDKLTPEAQKIVLSPGSMNDTMDHDENESGNHDNTELSRIKTLAGLE